MRSSPSNKLVRKHLRYASLIQSFLQARLTGQELRRIDAGGCHKVWLAFSPDGRQMVCAGDHSRGKLPLIDFELGKIIKTLDLKSPVRPEHGSRLAVFSPDSRHILTSHAGMWIYNTSGVARWEVASGEQIKEFFKGTDEPVSGTFLTPLPLPVGSAADLIQ